MTPTLSPELTAHIVEEAKNFAFYNYVSTAHNGSAVFEDIESWPDNARVAYYAIVNYMNGTGVCWPYPAPTMPMRLQAAEQQLEQMAKAMLYISNGGATPIRKANQALTDYNTYKKAPDERRL
jgi:hypothetical protein